MRDILQSKYGLQCFLLVTFFRSRALYYFFMCLYQSEVTHVQKI